MKKGLIFLAFLILGGFLNLRAHGNEGYINTGRLLKRVIQKLEFATGSIERGIKKIISSEINLFLGKNLKTYPKDVLYASELITSDYLQRTLYFLAGKNMRSAFR
jgi:hypothetical protein